MLKHGVKKGTASNDEPAIEELLRIMELKESLEKHKQLVVANPDAYNSWNALKEMTLNNEQLITLNEQLNLTEKAIVNNPKSYYAWYHRTFLFKMGNLDLEKEKKLCLFLLKLDPRNFHCFNHCNRLGIVIEHDFSNYSTLTSYYKYAENFLFTDPKEESSWRHFWKFREFIRLNPFYLRVSDKKTEIIFRDSFQGTIKVDNNRYLIEKPMRIFRINKDPSFSKDIEVFIENTKYTLHQERAPIFLETLKTLIPNNVFLLRTFLDYNLYDKEEISSRLSQIDPLRRNYYESIKLKKAQVYVISRN